MWLKKDLKHYYTKVISNWGGKLVKVVEGSRSKKVNKMLLRAELTGRVTPSHFLGSRRT